MRKNKIKGEKRMTRNKSATAIALFLMFAIAISLIALPATNAQTYPTKKTYAYIMAQPNPVGVGQSVMLIFGITDYLYEQPHGWTGITITVEKPDGKTETKGPYKTDSTGSTGAIYVPDQVGTYYFQVNFPKQLYNWTVRTPRAPTLFGPVWYDASTSEKYALVVKEAQLPGYPGFSLPTEYWTRPIDAQLREWSTIAGNWVSDPPNLFAPYNQGPETAHILWAKPLVKGGMSALGGGVTGGVAGFYGFEMGDAYEGFFGQRVIIGGVLYFNRYKADGSTRVEQEVVAVDLRTGEELWVRNWNNTRLDFGQLFYWDSFNYHGTFAYLWSIVGTTYMAYEASTGRWVFNITSVPSGTRVYGPQGEILIYTVDLGRGWMTKWNSTHVLTQDLIRRFGPTGSRHGSWIRGDMGTSLNGTLGIMWNKTIPTGLPGSLWTVLEGDMVVGNEMYGTGFHQTLGDRPLVFWAISLKRGEEGRLLYNVTWQQPLGDVGMWRIAVSAEDRVFTFQAKDLLQLYGFDLDTGKQIWGSTERMDQRSFIGLTQVIAYGKVFNVVRFAGLVECYDAKTGKLLWTYEVPDTYGVTEAWQKEFGGEMWPIRVLFVTDGKVYVGHSEHSPNNPLPRGAPFICLNATTGEEIFRIDGAFRQTDWGGRAIIGDSIIATMDSYDQRVYAIGKGPSAITVTASPEVSVHGSSVLVKGTVTDVSAGTKDSALTARFPNGVPAVADESMSDWMLYVYKQFERPADAVGVEVVVSVLDPNNNYYEVGRATADADGTFGLAFEPLVPGPYKIIATFEGSRAYYGSHAKTAINVEEAPQPTPAPTPTPASVADMYFLPVSIGMIVAIVIVLALLVLMLLRKR